MEAVGFIVALLIITPVSLLLAILLGLALASAPVSNIDQNGGFLGFGLINAISGVLGGWVWVRIFLNQTDQYGIEELQPSRKVE